MFRDLFISDLAELCPELLAAVDHSLIELQPRQPLLLLAKGLVDLIGMFAFQSGHENCSAEGVVQLAEDVKKLVQGKSQA